MEILRKFGDLGEVSGFVLGDRKVIKLLIELLDSGGGAVNMCVEGER